MKDAWGSYTTTEYPGVGVAGTKYNGDRVKTVALGGGEGGKGGSDYPKKSRRFGTEGFR